MKKGTGYYLKSYIKNNIAVLIFELIIIVLLASICTVLLGGQPVWLGPVLALCAYLLAELRFMMAYVASTARKDAEAAETENDAEDEADDEAEDEALGIVTPAVVMPAREEPAVEEPAEGETVVEEPAEEESAEEEPAVEEPAVEEPAVEEPAVEEPVVEDPEFAEPEETQEDDFDDDDFDDDFDLPARSTLDLGDE